MATDDKTHNKNAAPTIFLPKAPEYEDVTKSKQSANTLFTFMEQLDFLKDILRKKKIYPRYCNEKLDYLHIAELPSVAYPMKCFCDIFLNKLESHMKFYGWYGIGLTKAWGLANKIQPVMYINEKSIMMDTVKDLFQKYKADATDDDFHKLLRFVKPISGKMPRKVEHVSGEIETIEIEKNFHDEREWRYIPEIPSSAKRYTQYIEDPLILNNKKAFLSKSNNLARNDMYGLKITAADIKYIVVPSHSARDNLIDFITSRQCRFTKKEKYNLISKLIIFKEIEGDW